MLYVCQGQYFFPKWVFTTNSFSWLQNVVLCVSLYSAWHYFSDIVRNIKKRTFKLSFKIHNRKHTNTDVYNVKQNIMSFVWDLKSYRIAEAKAELCLKRFGTTSKSFKWLIINWNKMFLMMLNEFFSHIVFTFTHFDKGNNGMWHRCEIDVSYIMVNIAGKKLILVSF